MYIEMLNEFNEFTKYASANAVENYSAWLLYKLAKDLNIRSVKKQDLHHIQNIMSSLPTSEKVSLGIRRKQGDILANVKKEKDMYVAEDSSNIVGFLRKSDKPNHMVSVEEVVALPKHKDKQVENKLIEYVLNNYPYVQFKTKSKDALRIDLAKKYDFDLAKKTPSGRTLVWEKIKTIEPKGSVDDQYRSWNEWSGLPDKVKSLSDARLKNKLGVTNEELYKLVLDSSEIRRKNKLSNLFVIQPKTEIIAELVSAADNLSTINITYIDRGGNVTNREIEPYEIKNNKFWGYDIKKDGIRQFNLERIMDVKSSGKSFSPRFPLKMR